MGTGVSTTVGLGFLGCSGKSSVAVSLCLGRIGLTSVNGALASGDLQLASDSEPGVVVR